MHRKSFGYGLSSGILLLVVYILLQSVSVFGATGNESIVADQPEYTMGDTAKISGQGFEPNHLVKVRVIRVDGSIVTGNGTETPGSDIVTTDPYGTFTYFYLLDGGPVSAYNGILTVNAIDTFNSQVLATTTFKDDPHFLLQGCSWAHGDCTQDNPATGWADGSSPMDGWTSGNLKGWFELDNVPFRLRMNMRSPGDAGTYYISNEHDNLRNGVTGIDSASEFYVGVGPDVSGSTEGTLTKTCVLQATRAVGNNPTTSNPCIVTGPTFTGVDDDGDGRIDEEAIDGIDNDGDGLIDEDPIVVSGSNPARRIQYVWAVLFNSSEVGDSNKKWALYWKAHLALGASNFSGASLHTNTSASGSQDVPIVEIGTAQSANLSITKTDWPDPVLVNQSLTYTITVTNNGPANATGVTVTDTLPGGVTFVSATPSQGSCSGTSTVTCNLGSLANGASATVTIVVTPTVPGPITNTASVTGNQTDPNTSNNTDSEATLVTQLADLSISKTDSPDPVLVGQNLTYTLTVTNSGPSTATGVLVTDTLPSGVNYVSATPSQGSCMQASGTVTCSLGNLANGASANIMIVVMYNQSITSPVTISNAVCVTGNVSDPSPSNNCASASTTVNPAANLSITKTDSLDPVLVGQNLTYTLTVTNAGPSTATGVTVTDTLPSGVTYGSATPSQGTCNQSNGTVTCSLGSLASGATATVTIMVMYNQSITSPVTISNTACVSANQGDPITSNNCATQLTTVEPYPTCSDPDSDSDHLPSNWETLYGLNPNSAVCLDGANCDPDADGFDNLQEFRGGGNPQNLNSGPVQREWVARFNGQANSVDVAQSVVTDAAGDVYITGWSYNGINFDYLTVKYNGITGNQIWARTYDNGAGDLAHVVRVDGSGNAYVTGRSHTSLADQTYDIATVKYNSSGVQQWVNRYGLSGGSDQGLAMVLDSSGNPIITGPCWNGSNIDFCTIKLNTNNGNLIWDDLYNNGADDSGRGLTVDASGYVYATGWSQNAGFRDYATIKYAPNGNQLWVARYDGTGNNDDVGQRVAIDAGGNSYMTGWSYNGVNFDYTTVKYDPSGNQVWVARYDNGGGDFAHDIKVNSSGNVYVTGRSHPYPITTSFEVTTIKYNMNGNQVWVNRSSGGNDFGFNLVLDAEGSAYVAGLRDNGNSDHVARKYISLSECRCAGQDPTDGYEVWMSKYDNGRNDAGRDLAVDASKNVYVTGWSENSNGNRDYVTVKYSQPLSRLMCTP